MVTALRSRPEVSTVGLAPTMRLWLKAGVIKDSVMDTEEFNTKKLDEPDLEKLEDGAGVVQPCIEDEDQLVIMDG